MKGEIIAKPKYPVDSIRIARLQRGDAIGDVRIQWYADRYLVTAYVPGRPGETPEHRAEWFTSRRDAMFAFSAHCIFASSNLFEGYDFVLVTRQKGDRSWVEIRVLDRSGQTAKPTHFHPAPRMAPMFDGFK